MCVVFTQHSFGRRFVCMFCRHWYRCCVHMLRIIGTQHKISTYLHIKWSVHSYQECSTYNMGIQLPIH